MPNLMMKCGHVANATDGNGNPSCVICLGIVPGATVVDDSPPDLSGRKSKCTDCGSFVDSSTELPFFRYRPCEKHDSHYNGCRGWN